MKKKILIIGINSSPELTGIGRYTGEMIDWMLSKGYSITLVTSYPYYPHWKIQAPYSGKFYKKEINNNGTLITYRCPLYVPAIPTGFKRQLHEASFFLSSFFMICYLLFKKKHDATLTIAPPFFLGFLGLFYRLFKGTSFFYHIQDLQIDAAKVLGILKSKWMFSVLFWLERFILNNADVNSTISEGMLKKVSQKTGKKVLLFPNWVDTNMYFPIEHKSSLKIKWGFQPTDKIVIYSGSIGEKQGLDSLIRIAASLKSNPSIKFIICGIGPFKDKLKELADNLNLNNVYFFPLQQTSVFNEFLNLGDVHLVLQRGHASDLVMPSKLTTILAIGGLALVTAWPNTTLFDTLKLHNIGVVIDPDNEEVLKNSIVDCCQNPHSTERNNARAYSKTFLNKESILQKLVDVIQHA